MKQKTLSYTYYWGSFLLGGGAYVWGICTGAFVLDPPTIKITLC